MSFELQTAFIVISSVWLLSLTVLVWRLHSRYNKTTRQFTESNALAHLAQLLRAQSDDRKRLVTLQERVEKLDHHSLNTIQKIGLIRFNPFKDTGGDQSFILALLDAHASGVVLSGLFSRSGTRWYAKRVEKGNGVEHALSDEEKKAVAMAK